jgi:multidrug resistance efflux pump
MDQKNKNRHSAEMQEIIYAPPSWLIRWGVTVFVLSLSAFIALSFLVHYPDVANSELTLYESGTGLPVTAKVGGRVASVPVKNEQRVGAGQPLLYLEGPPRGARTTEDYTIRSPKAGRAHMVGLLELGQRVDSAQALYYISDSPRGQYYGALRIPQSEWGQIKEGQKVLVNLDAYRAEEFGTVNGVVDSIGHLPAGNHFFAARVRIFPPANKKMQLLPGLSGSARIITKDITLMDRIFGKLWAVKAL